MVPSAPNDDLVIGARDQDGIGSFGSVEVAEIVFEIACRRSSRPNARYLHKWGLTSHASVSRLQKFQTHF